jgi:hypothetical protein
LGSSAQSSNLDSSRFMEKLSRTGAAGFGEGIANGLEYFGEAAENLDYDAAGIGPAFRALAGLGFRFRRLRNGFVEARAGLPSVREGGNHSAFSGFVSFFKICVLCWRAWGCSF